jgi:hypothetical protein
MYSLILDIVQRASPGVVYPPPRNARNEPFMGQVTFFSKCRPAMSLPWGKLRFSRNAGPQ